MSYYRILWLPFYLGLLLLFFKRKISNWINQPITTDRQEYEYLSAERMTANDYSAVKVTPGTKDHGRDVQGYKSDKLRLGQCKMLWGKSKVGVKAVRELYGVAQSKKSKAIFFTTNGYTMAARKFATKRIQLIRLN